MKTVVTFILGAFLAAAGAVFADHQGWIGSDGPSDTEVIQAIERTQEVSLVSLSVQGIKATKTEGKRVGIPGFGFRVPGTARAQFMQYRFTAKLGIDGDEVTVRKAGDNSFRMSIPAFRFIGYDKPTFKVAVENGGALRWLTPKIDTATVITQILNSKARQAYVKANEKVLQAQTKVFYDNVIAGIDPDATVTYDFR